METARALRGAPRNLLASSETEKRPLRTVREPHMPQNSPAPRNVLDQRLSREVILAQALLMADEDGMENLSVRKLAGALGKTAMSLYRHFDSMDEIRQGIVALAFREVDTAPVPGERWDDTVRRTTASIRRMELNHAHAHLYLVEGSAWDPQLREHTDRVQKLHREQGIPEDILKRAWRIIDAFLSGFIVNELQELEHAAPAPVDGGPDWIETASGAYSEQAFRDGIEIIIAGIRGLAAPDPCEWRTPEDAGR